MPKLPSSRVTCAFCHKKQKDRGRGVTCCYCGASPMPSQQYPRSHPFYPRPEKEPFSQQFERLLKRP